MRALPAPSLMHLRLHLPCLTRAAPWDVRRFICRELTCLPRQLPGAALRVGLGLSPVLTRDVALDVLVPAQLCCSNLAFRPPEALWCLPLPGQNTHQLLYGKKAALR